MAMTFDPFADLDRLAGSLLGTQRGRKIEVHTGAAAAARRDRRLRPRAE
jgi:hypothetical protein